MIYTIYNIADGSIVSNFMGTLESLDLNYNHSFQGFIEGTFSSEDYTIDTATKSPVAIVKPNTPTVSLTERFAAGVRNKRNRLLAESDWTDTLSAKSRLGDDLYNQWQTYRQALRDIPTQSGYPFNVVWPTPPQK